MQDVGLDLGVDTAERVDALYRSIIPAGTHRASSLRVAEVASFPTVEIAIDDEVNGRIVWAEGIRREGDEGGSDLTDTEKFETRVYFGEQSPSYSIVGKASGGSNVELGLSQSGEDEGRMTRCVAHDNS